MKKFLFLVLLAFALVAGSANAATFSNVEFDNGDVTVQGTGGSTVNATFRVVVGANEVVEYIQTDVVGDNLAPVDHEVGGVLGLQEGTHFVDVSVKLPPNTGTYTLTVRGTGVYGGQRAIDGNSPVVGTATFNGALRVVSSGSTNVGSSSPIDTIFAAFQAKIDSYFAKLAELTNPTTPAPTTTKCTALSEKLVGTVDNTYNDANVKLQGYLLSEGMSIPALKAGASFGYKGVQTNSAIAQFKALNACI